MAVTLSGMKMEVRLVQEENAPFPMAVTLSGIKMEERFPQP